MPARSLSSCAVKQNFDRAYEQMSSKARSYLPLENFKETMIASHRDGYPKSIKATGVRPVKDASTIFVLLRGQAEFRPRIRADVEQGAELSSVGKFQRDDDRFPSGRLSQIDQSNGRSPGEGCQHDLCHPARSGRNGGGLRISSHDA